LEDRILEIELTKCVRIECKGDLVELESYEHFNWVTAVYKCTACGCEFSVKVET